MTNDNQQATDAGPGAMGLTREQLAQALGILADMLAVETGPGRDPVVVTFGAAACERWIRRLRQAERLLSAWPGLEPGRN